MFHHFFHHHPRSSHHDRRHAHDGHPHCMPRGHHRHPFEHFFGRGADMDRGQGFDAFERGRKIGSAELQLLILALLAEQARHGYELIKEIEQRSGGWYVPSPGMVYPALSYLEDAGYASVEAAGAKKLYTISVAGLAYLEEHRAAIDALWAQLALFGERMGRMRDEARFSEELSGDGRNQLHAAMEELRGALHGLRGSSPEQLARVIEILRRAAAEVRGGAAE